MEDSQFEAIKNFCDAERMRRSLILSVLDFAEAKHKNTYDKNLKNEILNNAERLIEFINESFQDTFDGDGFGCRLGRVGLDIVSSEYRDADGYYWLHPLEYAILTDNKSDLCPPYKANEKLTDFADSVRTRLAAMRGGASTTFTSMQMAAIAAYPTIKE